LVERKGLPTVANLETMTVNLSGLKAAAKKVVKKASKFFVK
jgi:hypothetical protein